MFKMVEQKNTKYPFRHILGKTALSHTKKLASTKTSQDRWCLQGKDKKGNLVIILRWPNDISYVQDNISS